MGRFSPGDVIRYREAQGPVPPILVLEEIEDQYVLAHANDANMRKFLRPVMNVDIQFERVVSRDVRNAVHEGEQ